MYSVPVENWYGNVDQQPPGKCPKYSKMGPAEAQSPVAAKHCFNSPVGGVSELGEFSVNDLWFDSTIWVSSAFPG